MFFQFVQLDFAHFELFVSDIGPRLLYFNVKRVDVYASPLVRKRRLRVRKCGEQLLNLPSLQPVVLGVRNPFVPSLLDRSLASRHHLVSTRQNVFALLNEQDVVFSELCVVHRLNWLIRGLLLKLLGVSGLRWSIRLS